MPVLVTKSCRLIELLIITALRWKWYSNCTICFKLNVVIIGFDVLDSRNAEWLFNEKCNTYYQRRLIHSYLPSSHRIPNVFSDFERTTGLEMASIYPLSLFHVKNNQACVSVYTNKSLLNLVFIHLVDTTKDIYLDLTFLSHY